MQTDKQIVGHRSMIVKFNGIMQKKQGGCSKCGQKSSSQYRMMPSKMFILPSGRTVTFFVGREEEVSESDGQFLLQYTYTDKQGATQSVFTEVK